MATMNSLAGFQDIFYHVISHLAADLEASDASYHESTDAKSVRRTLARLARVHSGLSRPALAALWRRLWDDRPLRHLLWVVGIARRTSSKHQWEIPPLEIRGKPATSYESIWEQVQECASLVRRIIFGTETWQSSWKRFQAYASLVREIILDPFVGIVDTPLQSKIWQDNFWRRLSSGLGNLPILPRLEAASLLTPNSFKHRSFDAGTLCLLNPSIRELNIIFPQAGAQDEFKVQKALSDCFSSTQNLEVLSVEIPIPVLDLQSLAQSHRRLHYLRLDTNFQINSNNLTHLASLHNLEYLSIDLSRRAPLNLTVTFTRLRILAVSGDKFGVIGALIAYMDAPQLRTFSISETHEDSRIMRQELSTILRTLVVKCPFLTAFEWESRQLHGQRDEPRSRAGTTLAKLIDPLLSHATIRSFSAHFRGPILGYTPTDFRTIAEAWPDVETFHLHDSWGQHYSDQHADLESVLIFARHCPRLRSLRIPEVKFDYSSLVGAAAEALPAAPHGLHDLLVMRPVVCSGEEDEERRREGRRQFRGWVENVFPFAMIRIPRDLESDDN